MQERRQLATDVTLVKHGFEPTLELIARETPQTDLREPWRAGEAAAAFRDVARNAAAQLSTLAFKASRPTIKFS